MNLINKVYQITIPIVLIILILFSYFKYIELKERINNEMQKQIDFNIEKSLNLKNNILFLSYFDYIEYGLKEEAKLNIDGIEELFKSQFEINKLYSKHLIKLSFLDKNVKNIVSISSDKYKELDKKINSNIECINQKCNAINSFKTQQFHIVKIILSYDKNAIIDKNSVKGQLLLVYKLNIESINNLQNELLYQMVLYNLMLLLFLVVLILIIVKMIVRPIKTLSEKIQQNDQRENIKLDTNIIEIKSLEESFCNYNKSINIQQEEILNLNKNLERKVLQRTQDQNTLLSIFDISDSVLFRWNNDEKFSVNYVSKSVEKLLGYTKNEFLSSKINYLDCIHKDDVEIVSKELKEFLLTNQEYFTHKPYRVVTKDAKTKWVYVQTVVQKNNSDDVKYFITYILDITNQKIYERKLKDQKKEFESIFHYAQDGIIIIDLNGNFLKFNKAFLSLTELDEESLFRKNYNEFIIPEYKEKNLNAINETIKIGHIENLEKVYEVNNKIVTVNVSMSLLPNKKSLLLVIKDISSLKALEEQSKLASMGEMIGNIAHQWRQPLNLISITASGLKMQSEFGQEITHENIVLFSDTIVTQTDYLSQTIDNFKNFIKGDTNHSILSIEQLIDNIISLTDAVLKNNNITLIKDIKPNLNIMGSLSELSEAFINIINNSKDVFEDKVENIDDRLILIDAIENNENVEITFKDTGGGIPQHILSRIFEPYFTSKHKSVGTGLGLSISEKIIRERNDGAISVHNKEFKFNDKMYKGAEFKITLPLIK